MGIVRQVTFGRMFVALTLLFGTVQTGRGESVYVINDTEDSKLQAYEIDGPNLVYQANYTCVTDTSGGMGAVGLGIDDSDTGQFLFVTFEGLDAIEVVDATSLKYVGTVEAPQASNLAGITMDTSKGKLYIIERETSHLYVYSWDAENKVLTLDYGYPYYVALEGCYQGYGLALDQENGRLFVGDNTTTVKYYDTNDPNWAKLGELTVAYAAIGIAVDVENQYVYTGNAQIGSNTKLSQYDLMADPNDAETTIDIGSPVLGIAVAQDTGLIYLTTYGTGEPTTQDRLLVYDPNFTDPCSCLKWSSGDIGNPAGVAVATGVGYKAPALYIEKSDDVTTCAAPDDPNISQIVYTIWYANPDTEDPNYVGDANNVVIVDYLPDDANFVSAEPDDGEYDSDAHTYTWEIGNLEPGDANYLYLTVELNYWAEPSSTITNRVAIESDEYYSETTLDTSICCWGGDVIYVKADFDPNYPGYGTGVSWADAYDDPQDALARARNGCGAEIWVARGTYTPGTDQDDAFELVDGVGIYGGFAGDETQRDQRNFVINHTKLTGDLDDDDDADSTYVVTADSSVTVTAVFDGFIITGGQTAGIYCNYGDPNIANCLLTKPGASDAAIRARYSDVAISHCVITDNEGIGMHFSDAGSPTVTNCTISKNGSHGIRTYKANPTIKNCCIHHNGTTNEQHGIDLQNLQNEAIVHNNTVVYNKAAGIKRSGSSADIANCIVWGNVTQLDGCGSFYSCIQDGNDVANSNVSDDPCFAYYDPNLCNYHLSANSLCIEAGDPCGIYTGQTDIDDDDRVYYTYVDIGADEYDCNDVYNLHDITGDGLVNLRELALIGAAWLTDPNDDNWNGYCDFDQSGCIDLADLVDLSRDWCWQACWRNNQTFSAMSSGTDGGFAMRALPASYSAVELQTARRNRLAAQRANAPLTNKQLIAICEEILAWALDAYKQNDIPEAFDEKTFLLFIDSLYDWLKELEQQN